MPSESERLPRAPVEIWPSLAPAARRGFGIRAIVRDDKPVPVLERNRLHLRFGGLTEFSCPGAPHRTALVVAPLAGGFPVLLRDLVLGLLQHCDRVAVTDWPDAAHVPAARGPYGFEDNVWEVATMVQALGPAVHVVAICQGVIPALIATALLAAAEPQAGPSSLTLVAGPVDPLARRTRLVNLLRDQPLGWFERHVIAPAPRGSPGEGRLVYPRALQHATLMGYVAKHWMGGGELARKLLLDDGEDPVRFPFWSLLVALMNLPGEFFLETVRTVFHERSLCAGRLTVRGEPIRLDAIRRTALLSIEGGADDIAAPGQTRAAHDLCRAIPDGRRGHLLVPGCGHFSLIHGRIWRRRILPVWAQFVASAAGAGPSGGTGPRSASFPSRERPSRS